MWRVAVTFAPLLGALTASPVHGQVHDAIGFDDISLGAVAQETDGAPTPPDETLPAAAPDEGWQFDVSPFVWTLSFDADVTVEGFETTVDMSFSDIWDALDFAAMVNLQARKDGWVAHFDFFYAKLGIDGAAEASGDITGTVGIDRVTRRPLFRRFAPRELIYDIPTDVALDVELDIDLYLSQLLLGYELVSIPLAETPLDPDVDRVPTLDLSPYGGVRYTVLDIETDVEVMAAVGAEETNGDLEFDDTERWLDPVVGLSVALHDIGKWSFAARADVGGFGLSNSSDLTWMVSLKAHWQLRPNVSLFGGYSFLDYDYSTGGGASEFAFDGRFEGPVLGAQFTF